MEMIILYDVNMHNYLIAGSLRKPLRQLRIIPRDEIFTIVVTIINNRY